MHRGKVDGDTLYVGHYDPWKPRAEAADKRAPKVGGNVRQFEAGETHRMALEVPIEDYFMGGIVNKYFGRQPTPSTGRCGPTGSSRWSSPPTSFSSTSFRFSCAVYFSLPRAWRNLWITVASYVFYGWWQPWFVCLMMFTTVMDFMWGKVITRPGATEAQRKLAVAACVVTNLSFLGFFKYYMFAAETLNQLLAAVGAEQFRVLKVILPIGISFYTFHSLTYIIDLYRGHATPAKSFTDFSAFVALFPDLVAGPIIRYKTLAEQLASRTTRCRASPPV